MPIDQTYKRRNIFLQEINNIKHGTLSLNQKATKTHSIVLQNLDQTNLKQKKHFGNM